MFYKFLNFTGPAQYVWKDPDTGHLFKEKNKQDLINRITIYRSQNNLEEIEQLSFVLESYWCSLPENFGRCEAVKSLPRGLLGYIKGGVALLRNLAYKDFAKQEVADERSRICSNCPLNVFPDRNGFIRWSNDIAEASVGDRKASHHDELGQCAACSCPLRAKVFYTGKINLTAEQEELIKTVKPDCWQLKKD